MSAALRLSPLTLAMAVAMAACPAVAQQAPDEVQVITADRFGDANDQLMVVDTIDRKTIETLAPKSVYELLARLPGITVTSNGGPAQSGSVMIRGANANHTLVLIDGVRTGSATLGTTPLEALAPEQIERIEVLKGPRAAIWGSDAIGGVIQIFTRKLDQGQWYAAAEGGSNGYWRTSAGAGVSHGDGHTSLTVNHEQSDGFNVRRLGQPDDDGYQRTSLALRGEQRLTEQWQLNWSGQVTDGNYEYDYDPTWGPGHDQADYLNYHYAVGAQFDDGVLTSKLQLSQMQDQNEHYNEAEPTLGVNEFRTQRHQLSWLNQVRLDALTLASGIDWYEESVEGDYAKDSRHVFGLYSLARYDHARWLAEGVVRMDNVSGVDSEVSYQASLGYRFTDTLHLSVSNGTGFKVPTFNDLYYPGSGNPDLVSERSENWEVTLHYAGNGVKAHLSGFHNDVEDLIQWAPVGDSTLWVPQNIADATLKGAEFGLEYQVGAWMANAGYTYTDAADGSTGASLIGRSEHQADLGLGYQWRWADVRADYHYQGEREGSGRQIDAYQLVNMSVGYQPSAHWDLRLKLNNLLDDEIVSSNDYYGPGREFFVSVSYRGF
ncbi:TonB-dependent receptor domain-containing protein [Ferrimonas balearica]|uniref:TonB-dependent receptor domain-containing protein n=1 Tax=Ferrimonas balearica TaxID=44012 RepID=UPI001C95EA35|nr:TonB-dependent receptor [Ferrimonas balearica]MBY6226168.1 TonB-dependent receptor [Ferrimonas balearica]